MQYPPQGPSRQTVSSGPLVAIIGIVCVIGALLGAMLVFGAIAAKTAATKQVPVPVRTGYGKATSVPLGSGWNRYTFSDLDLTVDLPGSLTPQARAMPMRNAQRVKEAVTYSGRTGAGGFRLGAFWEKPPFDKDPVRLAKYNMTRPVSGYQIGEPTYARETLAGSPACASEVSYVRGGQAIYKSVLVLRGDAVYYFEIYFWESKRKAAEADYDRILKSIHFASAGS
jgi:hypothetical protein